MQKSELLQAPSILRLPLRIHSIRQERLSSWDTFPHHFLQCEEKIILIISLLSSSSCPRFLAGEPSYSNTVARKFTCFWHAAPWTFPIRFYYWYMPPWLSSNRMVQHVKGWSMTIRSKDTVLQHMSTWLRVPPLNKTQFIMLFVAVWQCCSTRLFSMRAFSERFGVSYLPTPKKAMGQLLCPTLITIQRFFFWFLSNIQIIHAK